MYSLRDALSKVIEHSPLVGPREYLSNIIIVIQKAIFNFDLRRFENFTLVDLVTDSGFTFVWHSRSTQSTCPRCDKISTHQRHTYKNRVLIDQEILGRPVMHMLRVQQYICDYCAECDEEKRSFVEDLSPICRAGLKTTRDLDEKIVNDGINRSANGLASDYEGRIDVSYDTILNRVKEAGSMVTEKRLTEVDSVSVLSVDDNNGRKGNPSTGCTVAIDLETHNILVVAQGTTSDVAKKIFDRFPEATTLSRDRACAYSKAANDCSLEQVADIFHLIQNAHTAVKDELARELRHNIYIREGDGWVEWPANPGVSSSENPVPVFTLTEEDIAERVRLAHLSARQETKYRRVINLLRLYDEGLSQAEAAKRLGITWAQSRFLLAEAGDVVNNVESRIDKYLVHTAQGRQKTIGVNARPSSESIVAPYSETVMKMVAEGQNHRSIHPVIKEMGFEGSANSIYQYILKKKHEESGTDTEDTVALAKMPCPNPDCFPRRPKRVCLQRVAKGNLYKYVLHEVATGREMNKDKVDRLETDQKAELFKSKAIDPSGVVKTDVPTATAQQPIQSHASSAFYSDDVADILFRQVAQADDERKKKTSNLDFQKIEGLYPIIGQSKAFLSDLHRCIDNADIGGLTTFIDTYKTCGVVSFERYARGLDNDFNAVKNAILKRGISNGPMEGINNKIKLLRRTRYGRAKIELVNALAVLSSIGKFRYADYAPVKRSQSTRTGQGISNKAA